LRRRPSGVTSLTPLEIISPGDNDSNCVVVSEKVSVEPPSETEDNLCTVESSNALVVEGITAFWPPPPPQEVKNKANRKVNIQLNLKNFFKALLLHY
jgi:hypothetical protein